MANGELVLRTIVVTVGIKLRAWVMQTTTSTIMDRAKCRQQYPKEQPELVEMSLR
jgi:hypothetical protein